MRTSAAEEQQRRVAAAVGGGEAKWGGCDAGRNDRLVLKRVIVGCYGSVRRSKWSSVLCVLTAACRRASGMLHEFHS